MISHLTIKKHSVDIKSRWILYGGLLFVVLLTSVFSFLFFTNNDKDVQATQSIQETTPLEDSIQHCLSLSEGRDACYFALCSQLRESSYLCAEDLLDIITKISGPEQGISSLHDIMESSLFGIRTDGHNLAHVVGNATSHYYGLNIDAFLRCPNDFNFACPHGFFEDALREYSDPLSAAITICKDTPQNAYEDKFYCYHGVGHGFMTFSAYNLKNALSLCDQLPFMEARYTCWEGVFMENSNGFSEGLEGEMGLDENDLLAPCNRIEEKYRTLCYKEHGTYLMMHSNMSIPEASHVCLGAGDSIYDCMTSLAVLVIVLGWQEELRGSFEGTPAETTAYLCSQFLPEYIEMCQSISIYSMLSKDRTDIHMKATDFCSARHSSNKDMCFKMMGTVLSELTYDTNEQMQICNTAPAEYRQSCYEGAGIDVSEVI